MGAIVPTITGLTTAITAVDNLVGTVKGIGGSRQQATDNSAELLRAQQALALKQLKEQQLAEERNLQAQTALDRATIKADTDAAEQDRLSALRRAVARQRAAYGAQGIEANDGSAEAVLLGMFQESDADRASRERLDNIRNAALDQDLQNRQSLNVLQVSQLKEKQRLQRIAESA